MLDFATTRLGQRFLVDVTRIAGGLEMLGEVARERELLPESTPSVPIVSEVIEELLHAELLQRIGLLTHLVAVDVRDRQLILTFNYEQVVT